jgi:imidazolonepropionase-like amidohydrolase
MPFARPELTGSKLVRKLRRIFLIAGLSVLVLCGLLSAQDRPLAQSKSLEQGDFVLNFLQHAIGTEHYDLKQSADGSLLNLTDSFEYTDRGTRIPLTAALEMASDATPRKFVLQGRSYRYFLADASVELDGDHATVHDAFGERQFRAPAHFFTVSGYAPLAVQMMMLRYWLRHGHPDKLETLPAGDLSAPVTIALAGHDTVNLDGKPVTLDRYTVNNVVWGRESLWLDPQENLIAATTYTGGLAFEAVRTEYESAFKQFLNSAVADRMKDLVALSAGVQPITSGTFAITGVRLIDGTGRDPIDNAAVIVRDSRIEAAGPHDKITIPRRMNVIDMPGRTLLPGLWEMHAHYAQIEWGPVYLAAGVTTARDCGNEFEFITAVRDLIDKTGALGPHLLLAGLIDGTGPASFGVNAADTPEEARVLVQKYKNAGFSQIKVYSVLKPDVLKAITEEAHRLGLSVTGHVPNGLNAFEGVEDGMDQINHIGYVETVIRPGGRGPVDPSSPDGQKAIQFFKDHHTVIDPTLSWNELLGRPTNVDIASFEPEITRAPYQLTSLINTAGVAPVQAARWQSSLNEQLAVVKALFDAGIPIVPGTDKGVPGVSLHRELELYVRAGLTPMQAIETATSVPARVMKLDRDVGTVEAGKRANLILVDGDPLKDFSSLRKIELVISNGRIYKPEDLWKSVGFKP